jgi:hypothetical protein
MKKQKRKQQKKKQKKKQQRKRQQQQSKKKLKAQTQNISTIQESNKAYAIRILFFTFLQMLKSLKYL